MGISVEKNNVNFETKAVDSSKKQLLWIAMVSISMFFGGLLSALIVDRGDVNNWNEFVLPDYFLYSTGVIIFSSLLLLFVKNRLRNGSSAFGLVFLVLILGIVFSYFQINGWKELVDQQLIPNLLDVFRDGWKPEEWTKSGGFLLVLTLMHLLHLVGGLIAMCISVVKSKRKLYSIDNYVGLELTSVYWHFLTVLWVIIFFFLKSSAIN